MTSHRVSLKDLNELIVCKLCGGYFIDPVTLTECMHSFCKTCIVRHAERSQKCPNCSMHIHKTKPFVNMRVDKSLQDIVYKLVPGLHEDEMRRRKIFYAKYPPSSQDIQSYKEERDKIFFSEYDKISLSIEYYEPNDSMKQVIAKENKNRRYLNCPGMVKIKHLKKFIANKYGLNETFLVDVIYKNEVIPEEYTLIDCAYLYNWRKDRPMEFFYRIFEKRHAFLRKRKQKVSATNNTKVENSRETGEKPSKVPKTEETANANSSEKAEDSQIRSCKLGILETREDPIRAPVPIKVSPRHPASPLSTSPKPIISASTNDTSTFNKPLTPPVTFAVPKTLQPLGVNSMSKVTPVARKTVSRPPTPAPFSSSNPKPTSSLVVSTAASTASESNSNSLQVVELSVNVTAGDVKQVVSDYSKKGAETTQTTPPLSINSSNKPSKENGSSNGEAKPVNSYSGTSKPQQAPSSHISVSSNSSPTKREDSVTSLKITSASIVTPTKDVSSKSQAIMSSQKPASATNGTSIPNKGLSHIVESLKAKKQMHSNGNEDSSPYLKGKSPTYKEDSSKELPLQKPVQLQPREVSYLHSVPSSASVSSTQKTVSSLSATNSSLTKEQVKASMLVAPNPVLPVVSAVKSTMSSSLTKSIPKDTTITVKTVEGSKKSSSENVNGSEVKETKKKGTEENKLSKPNCVALATSNANDSKKSNIDRSLIKLATLAHQDKVKNGGCMDQFNFKNPNTNVAVNNKGLQLSKQDQVTQRQRSPTTIPLRKAPNWTENNSKSEPPSMELLRIPFGNNGTSLSSSITNSSSLHTSNKKLHFKTSEQTSETSTASVPLLTKTSSSSSQLSMIKNGSISEILLGGLNSLSSSNVSLHSSAKTISTITKSLNQSIRQIPNPSLLTKPKQEDVAKT